MQWKKGKSWLAALVGIMVVLSSAQVFAEPERDIHGDRIHAGAEESYGEFNWELTDQGVRPQEVVINDRIYTVDENAIFRTAEGELTTLSSFKEGMAINFYAKYPPRTLTKMWPTTERETEEEGLSSAKKETKPKEIETLHQENGVWKN